MKARPKLGTKSASTASASVLIGLSKYVDGELYFDTLADDVVFNAGDCGGRDTADGGVSGGDAEHGRPQRRQDGDDRADHPRGGV
jgi:hypothetical protein